MTATITEEETGIEEELFFDEAIPCDNLDPDDDCNNSADYRTQTACCGHVLMLCQRCLFIFIDFARENEGEVFHCAHCHADVVLTPNHLIVTGRL